MKTEALEAEVCHYNPDFIRRVWAKRRKAERIVTPIQPAEIEAAPEPVFEKTPADFATSTTREVIEYVARKHGLTYRDIIGKCRKHRIVAARHEAICMAAQAKPLTLPELGRRFGGLDHTSVLYALRKNGVDRLSQHKGGEG